MDDTGEGSRATRREVLGATAGALAVGALPGRSSAQQASGPTVYVGSDEYDGENFSGTLYAVDAATGEQEWAFTQPSGSVFSSPTVADGTVYVGSYDETLYAVDAATGSQEWAFTQPSYEVRSSPTVADGTVYVGSGYLGGNTLYAVDADSGTQEWAFTQPSDEVESSPTVADGTVYVGSYDNTLYAVDAATGEQEWAFTQPSGPVFSSPTVVDGTVYVGSWDETLYAVDAATGSKEWAFTQPSDWVESSPTVADGTVYVGSDDHTLYAVDADSGTQEWAFTQPSDEVESSPTVADGTVYVGSYDNTLYAVDAATGEQEWAFTQPSEEVDSSPTVADGTVYVGSTDETLYAVDAATGSQEWAFTQPSDAVSSSPTVVADPASGDSVGSRVLLGTLGHHGNRADRVTRSSPASFGVTIGETAQTQAGEPLTVAIDVENSGDSPGTGSIELSVPGLGSTSETVSLNGGEVTTDFVLSLQTTEEDAGEYTATVSTDDDSTQQTVTVLAPAAFTVDITDVTDPVAGDSLEATVSVENTGDVSGDQTVELSSPGLGSTSETVSLDSGEVTTNLVLSLQTTEGDAGEYTATVSTDDDSTQQTVTVLTPASFTVDITDLTDPVAGDSLEATVSVENTGDVSGEQTIELSASGLGSDSTTVSLNGGESTTETLSLSTGDGDAGEYALTVDAGDDDATETVTVAEPDPDDASGDDGGASGDDSESSDDGGPSDGSDTSDDSIDGDASGDGGLGTTEMAAIGGGGTLALLFGAYALMRRGGDDGDDSTPERPSEPDTPGRGTTAPSGSQSSDSGPGDTVDDLLDDVAQTLDSARQSADASEYDRALARCERAITTAKEARATARRDAPDLVPDAEDTLDDATTLRETIQAERDARQQTTDALDTAEGALDDAAAALDGGSPEAALETLDGVAGSLDTARASIADHEFPALAERVATLEQRQERLQQAAREARTRVPAEIPGVTRHSLSYADIEKRGELGRGGNADVFRATARTDGGDIDIALKEPRMSGDGTLHTEVVERMIDEAETWQRLDGHDHIVGVVDYGSEPLPWIAMEHMDAGHLGERAGDLPLDQALWTAIATAEGVRHAHRRGVAHLDLKPENVLFRAVADAWNAPKVADWGLSKHLLEHSQSVEGVTPYYAAPEQFADGYGTPDDITDVYQLGAVFYELFTGRPPFEGRPMRVMRQVETEQPTPPSDLADVPAGLDDVLLTALATERDERYDAVVLLRNDLQELFDRS